MVPSWSDKKEAFGSQGQTATWVKTWLPSERIRFPDPVAFNLVWAGVMDRAPGIDHDASSAKLLVGK